MVALLQTLHQTTGILNMQFVKPIPHDEEIWRGCVVDTHVLQPEAGYCKVDVGEFW